MAMIGRFTPVSAAPKFRPLRGSLPRQGFGGVRPGGIHRPGFIQHGQHQFHGGPVHRPPGTPVPGATAPGQAPVSGPQLDSTAESNINTHTFNAFNTIAAIQLRDAIANSQLQSTLGRLGSQQPRAELGLEQQANRGGGLYSSVYNQNLGNLNTGFADRMGDARTAYANQLAGDASQIGAIRGGVPLYNEGQTAASTARASLAAQNNPAIGQQTPAQGPIPKLAQRIARQGGGPRRSVMMGRFGSPHPGRRSVMMGRFGPVTARGGRYGR